MTMSDDFDVQKAMILFERAYRHQMRGEFGDAIVLYKRSLDISPTAEAYTYLGWAYSMMDRYEEAIEYCKKAIELDPTFGNPYNDIGSYLIEQGDFEEAVPWLDQAIQAPRYESRQFPHLNLGRVHEHTGHYRKALESYDRALEIDPFYRAAAWAKYDLIGGLN
jgi:tetratricopeptide (TPR) repeat protein